MKTKFGYAALAAVVSMAAGCASTATDEQTDEVAVVETETAVTPAPVPTPTPTPTPMQAPDMGSTSAASSMSAVQATGSAAAGSIEDFVTNAGDRVYFDVDRYNLDETDRAVLQAQAQWLMSFPNTRILVAGNCDERGTREYNIALGERRAASAADYLIGLGVPKSRIETISYGKSRPTDPRSTPEAWAINRNAHTMIVSGASN